MNGGRIFLAALACALVVAPGAAGEDAIELMAPANGATARAGTDVRFAWSNPLGGGFQALLVATDPAFADVVAVRAWTCAPSCATSTLVAGLAPGTYFWGVGFKVPEGVAQLSAPWSFRVVASPKAKAPLKPPARKKPRPKRRPR